MLLKFLSDSFRPINKDNLNPKVKDLIDTIVEVENERLENEKVIPRHIYDEKVHKM